MSVSGHAHNQMIPRTASKTNTISAKKRRKPKVRTTEKPTHDKQENKKNKKRKTKQKDWKIKEMPTETNSTSPVFLAYQGWLSPACQSLGSRMSHPHLFTTPIYKCEAIPPLLSLGLLPHQFQAWTRHNSHASYKHKASTQEDSGLAKALRYTLHLLCQERTVCPQISISPRCRCQLGFLRLHRQLDLVCRLVYLDSAATQVSRVSGQGRPVGLVIRDCRAEQF